MIERAIGYIVSNGFTLQAKTGDEIVNGKLEKLRQRSWLRPEIKNVLSGRKCEKLVCRELITVGDTGILKTNKKKIQLIEAEQIVGKGGYGDDGIEKDSNGIPTAFNVGGYNKSGTIDRRTIKSYSPDVFLFLSDPERPSSLRGVPPCQASFPMLHRINDVCDSEAIAWQLLARMAVSVTRDKGKELGYAGSKQDPNKTDDELAVKLTELDYALIFHGNVGDEIKGIERNIPGKNFSESLLMFLRILGLPLGLPLEVILLDWTKSNYSQSRAVLEQAFKSFLGWQYEICDSFLTPIYEWQVRQWMKDGEVKESDTIFDHGWIMPTFPWIDQLKEAEAYGMKVDRCFNTHQEVCKSLGRERDDIVAARVIEVKDAIDKAQKITKETGTEVPWQIFCGLEVPGAAKKSSQPDETSKKPPAKGETDD
jgi:hypothetical protein